MTESDSYPLDQWGYQSVPPDCSGRIRTYSSDFRVTEELGFDLAGEGKHLWLFIEKTDLNTLDVSRGLARATGLHQKEVGFSGQKDRNAVTAQWFSVLAEQDASGCMEKVVKYCEMETGLTLLASGYHTGKLKTGSHRRNLFSLLIRELSGNLADLEGRLTDIKTRGVPNYFGPQRFGRNGKNLLTAVRLFSGENSRLDRQARSMALSSARSWIFNQVVSERLKQSGFLHPQKGDALMLDGTHSWFLHDGSDANVHERWKSLDLHITAPMWGKGVLQTKSAIQAFEQSVVSEIETLPEGLQKQGLVQQRRAIRILPQELDWQFPEPGGLQLQFGLARGGFATAVLRELIKC